MLNVSEISSPFALALHRNLEQFDGDCQVIDCFGYCAALNVPNSQTNFRNNMIRSNEYVQRCQCTHTIA